MRVPVKDGIKAPGSNPGHNKVIKKLERVRIDEGVDLKSIGCKSLAGAIPVLSALEDLRYVKH